MRQWATKCYSWETIFVERTVHAFPHQQLKSPFSLLLICNVERTDSSRLPSIKFVIEALWDGNIVSAEGRHVQCNRTDCHSIQRRWWLFEWHVDGTSPADKSEISTIITSSITAKIPSHMFWYSLFRLRSGTKLNSKRINKHLAVGWSPFQRIPSHTKRLTVSESNDSGRIRFWQIESVGGIK